MAISAPTELSHDHVVANASSLTTTAASYTSGRLYVAVFGGSGATIQTVSSVAGASGTWTKLGAGDVSYTDGTGWGLAIFTATDATGASQSLTGTYSGLWALTQFGHVFEITSGFDTTGMIVQSGNNTVLPTATSLTVNLADSAASANMRIGYFAHRINEAFTALNSGNIVGSRQLTAPASVKALWYLDGVTTNDPGMSWATNTRGAIASAFELKAQAAAGASTTQFLQLLGAGT